MLANKSARDFLLAAKYARITAIERQSPCRMVLDTENSGFWLLTSAFNEESGQTEQAVEIFRKLAQLDFNYKDVAQRVDKLRKPKE